MEFIQTLIDQANNILWGYVMIIALLGCAVYFTLRSRFVQFSMIGEMCRQLVNSTERHLDNGRKHISPFQAFVVSLASRVGTGNLAGVATAIAVGGAGAVFWMWISAILGMCTKFSEVTLAVHFRERNAHGDYVGGPMYYIKNGLGSKWMWVTPRFLIWSRPVGIPAEFAVPVSIRPRNFPLF